MNATGALHAPIERNVGYQKVIQASILRSMSKRARYMDGGCVCAFLMKKKACSDQKEDCQTCKWQRWFGRVAAGTSEKMPEGSVGVIYP